MKVLYNLVRSVLFLLLWGMAWGLMALGAFLAESQNPWSVLVVLPYMGILVGVIYAYMKVCDRSLT